MNVTRSGQQAQIFTGSFLSQHRINNFHESVFGKRNPGERALKMGFPASKNCSGEKIFKGTYPLSTPGSSNRILTNHKKKTHHLEFTLGKWIRVSSYDFDKLLVKCSWKTCPYINEHENYENYFPSAYKQPKNVLYDRSKTTVWRRARKKLTGAIK